MIENYHKMVYNNPNIKIRRCIIMLEITIPISNENANIISILQTPIYNYLTQEFKLVRGKTTKDNLIYFVGGDNMLNYKFIVNITKQSNNLIINLKSLLKTQTKEYANNILNKIKKIIINAIK